MSIFSRIPQPKVKKSKFNLSHENLLTCNMGKLVPIYVEDVLPGDKFKVKHNMKIRMQPLKTPMMTSINAYVYDFFVPYRLIWDNAGRFFTTYKQLPNPDGTLQDAPVLPYVALTNATRKWFSYGGLMDYVGIPIGDGTQSSSSAVNFSPIHYNSLPFRAYQLIYNEFFRDENLDSELVINKGDGQETDLDTLLTLRTKCWKKDYFTSALPFAQRGADVTIPIAGDEPVNVTISSDGDLNLTSNYSIEDNAGNELNLSPNGTPNTSYGPVTAEVSGSQHNVQYHSGLKGSVDLSNVSGATINELRTSFALQRWLERSARAGARYIEQIKAHFGVTSSDARLQRPEFLGAHKVPILMSEVLQTSATEDTSVQANPAGYAGNTALNGSFKRFFEEHGVIVSLLCVAPDPVYSSMCPRYFLKSDVLDFAFPEFANLGEQEIWNAEVYSQGLTNDNAKNLFGYQSRYAEYKYHPSSVHGQFRNTELNFWHLARVFENSPALNSSFVHYDSDSMNRIFAVDDGSYNNVLAEIYNDVKAIRPLPKYGIPSII